MLEEKNLVKAVTSSSHSPCPQHVSPDSPLYKCPKPNSEAKRGVRVAGPTGGAPSVGTTLTVPSDWAQRELVGSGTRT